jgi:hypothetical protein
MGKRFELQLHTDSWVEFKIEEVGYVVNKVDLGLWRAHRAGLMTTRCSPPDHCCDVGLDRND